MKTTICWVRGDSDNDTKLQQHEATHKYGDAGYNIVWYSALVAPQGMVSGVIRINWP